MARDRVEQVSPEQVIKERRRRLANRNTVKSFFLRLMLLGVMLWAILMVIFGITPMKNADMSPRISAGDLLLFYRLEEKLHIGDVVILQKNSVQYAGRIVAQGGDTVEITDSAELKVNDSIVAENDIYFSTPRYDSDVSYPLKLGEGQYFILCDYREGARDSRYYGAVDTEEISGKVITVIRRSGI